ncbi:hypothetical protein CkaCkLH20_03273 [Colletotrichum karsti]|uniref:Major facilitator superfamily (MFS) profile domain-containing protein n=1 Tax=Colletotrichum karsti TaxID=1095194 RepID=A0A9P6IHG5_9PEZI|nr:uncharacterized protein CkaCkLH20_03273 [Colletotrichum karsti]KAF9879040.1 hypothetical protein CkaCkLH20_03273 [Colletotrichum karsti]
MTTQRSPWSVVTPMLLYSSFCLLVGDMLYGYDTGSFGGVLANQGFIRQFGTYNPHTEAYTFDSLRTSLISSLAFIGKFIGCFVAAPAIERLGHRNVFYLLSVVSVIGVILEITAADTAAGTGRYPQFIVGRIVVYISVGLVEVNVTTYQSEIVPAAFRGLVVISLQLFLNAGTLVATGINKAFSTDTSPVGWKTVTGVQLVFPALIALFTLFIPSSPRWLLSKDREEDAVTALCRLRPKEDAENGNCEAEIVAIRGALQSHVHKGTWTDLLRSTNFRRTTIVIVYYFFQQTTGQAFVSTYQTVFYRENRYAAHAFTYPIINSCLGMIAVLPSMYMVDKIGRRYSLLISFFFQCFFMYLLAGLGQQTTKTATESNTIVAAFMLFAFSYNMGGASIPYLLGTEIPNASLREKTQSLGAAWNVIWAFVTNFIIPYMIDSIHFQVGWVFGSISLAAFIFTFLVLPETKVSAASSDNNLAWKQITDNYAVVQGRALEEIDNVFSVAFNPFRSSSGAYEGAARRVGQLEGDKIMASNDMDNKNISTADKPHVSHV